MDIYEALNLTKGEEKVYRTLVMLNQTTTGPIYKHAKVSQSKVYEILDRLQKKGLATCILKENVTYWSASNPAIYKERVKEDLLNLQKRKEVIDEELPQLLLKQKLNVTQTEVYTEYNGFRSCLYALLDTFSEGDEFSVLGSPIIIPEPFHTFLKAHNLERIEKKIKARFLYGEKLRKFATSTYALPKTKLKFLKGLTPSTIAIGKDRIIIMTWEDNGKFVVIRGNEIAQNYLAFFESLWNMAKK